MSHPDLVATPSQWDSEVFNHRVGILVMAAPVDLARIAEANGGAFDVVFVKQEGWADQGIGAVALDHLYDMELRAGGASVAPRTILSVPSPRHVEIARTAFHDSRFLRDRRLAFRAPEMYARWVSGKEVHVLEGAPDDAFLLATKDEDGARRVSLVAVDSGRRDVGTGHALLAGAIQHDRASAWRVRVSARNHRAIRFYENAGFRVLNVRTAFHVWTAGG